jgi:tellurite resistance protein TerC
LIYLSYGLATILGFIGVKLVLHALHENDVAFINDGDPVPVAEISTALSLSVILGVLSVTVLASLASAKGRAQSAVAATRHHALDYLQTQNDPAYRGQAYERLVREIEVIKSLPERYRARIRAEEELMALLRRAQDEHAAAGAGTGGSAPSIVRTAREDLPRPRA